MKNDEAGLPSRTMDAFSLEVLPGYTWDKWLFGLDIDYRWEGQLTKLSEAGETNLKGKGWLLGVGAKYSLTPDWSLQAAIDFLGDYHFAKPTYLSADDGLKKPRVLRLKAQYHPWTDIPLSVDADFQYITFQQLRILSVDTPSISKGFLIGAGLTWHFTPKVEGAETPPAVEQSPVKEEPVPAPIPVPPPAQDEVASQEAEISQVAEVKRTERGLLLNLSGDVSFASGSAKLNERALDILKNLASILVKYPGTRIRIEGHTDSSGISAKNQTLSERRSESVKAQLVANGVQDDRISYQGFGATHPLADNATVEGRAINRRVEIYMEGSGKQEEGR